VIPVEIDVQQIIADLNSWGWVDHKIEMVCGLSNGYVAKVRLGARPMRPYQYCARLYNFWEEESRRIKILPTG
jgi:hypothetical protein